MHVCKSEQACKCLHMGLCSGNQHMHLLLLWLVQMCLLARAHTRAWVHLHAHRCACRGLDTCTSFSTCSTVAAQRCLYARSHAAIPPVHVCTEETEAGKF